MMSRYAVCVLAHVVGLGLGAAALEAQYPSVPPPPPCHDVASSSSRSVSSARSTRSLGIVLFQNTATSPNDAFLGRAVDVRLADALLGTPSLSIVASQKFGYEAVTTARGAAAVAHDLGVRYVLGGRVGRTEAGDVAVAAELRRPSDGAVIWGLSRSTPIRNLPALVDEIASGVVNAVNGGDKAAPIASVRLAGWDDTPQEAVVANFLRGTYYTSLNTVSGYEAALAQFDSAARSDPGFAPASAHAAVAVASTLEWGWWDFGEPRVRELVERGLVATDRALKLDSTNAKAWMARGTLLTFRNPRSFDGAFDAFRRAVAAAPRDPEVRRWYGRALMQVGQRAAAKRELEKALDLAPTDAGVLFDLAQLYRHDGGFNKACIMLDSAVAASPTAAQVYILRALTRARRGELRFAWADAETGGRLGWPYWAQSASAIIDAKSRDTTSARRRADTVRRAAEKTGNRPQEWTGEYLAAALAASGQRDRALDLLEQVRPRGARLWFALTGPDFTPLRASPRYQRLVAASRPQH
jgi:tetratricopeptide (TPR) repeat protein/TolB-like protein